MTTPLQTMGAFAADAVRYAGDTQGNGAYFLRDEDGGGTNLNVPGNLTVGGTTALAGSLTVGTTSVVAPTTLNGSLAVLGATNLNGAAQCGSGFTVGGGLSVVSGNLAVAVGGTTTLQATTTTTLAATGNVTVTGNESVSGTVLIGTFSPSVQQQIQLIAGPPQPWAPVNPYLQIGDNVAGNAAVRCQNIRTNELSCFSTQTIVAAGAGTASLGTAMVGAGTYIVTIVETDNTAVSTGAGYFNMALEGILRSPTGTLVRVGSGTSIGGSPNGVTYTLTYNAGTFGMEIAIQNTSSATPPATFLVSVSCLSLISYPE
jgi:hypothetical protein